MTKKEATKRWRRCREPGLGPITPLPRKGADREDFEAYNEEALTLFHEHADNCLWCRTTNKAAMDALRKAEEEARRKAAEEEARRLAEEEARRKALEDEARRRAEDEAQRQAAEDDARRKAAEEEAARRRALEEEARRVADEAIKRGLELEAARQRALEDEEAKRRAEEEEDARLAEEIAEAERRRLRLLALGKKKYLRKGEGTIAANQTARIQGEKNREEKAKHDIADFSISHAKKRGLVNPSSDASGHDDLDPQPPKVVLAEVDADMDEQWDQEWDQEKYERFEKMRNNLQSDTAA